MVLVHDHLVQAQVGLSSGGSVQKENTHPSDALMMSQPGIPSSGPPSQVYSAQLSHQIRMQLGLMLETNT